MNEELKALHELMLAINIYWSNKEVPELDTETEQGKEWESAWNNAYSVLLKNGLHTQSLTNN